ncbi:MAG: hypothetical protein ACI8T1_002047, partial [Verrucomicrobiales bacterium]
MFPSPDSSLKDVFLSPLLNLVLSCNSFRQCPDLTDTQFLEVGLLRVVAPQESGRDFLQSLSDVHSIHLQRSQFFATLKSKRRLAFLQEISQQLKDSHQHRLAYHDPFADMQELDGREIYAGDGHYIEHACHDLRQPLYKNNPYVAIGHFFAINLRTHWLDYLDLAGEGTKKQHDIAVMKKVSKLLKVDGKKGAIWVWDKAGIDFRFWHNQKQAHGVYFVSRLKKNMKPQKCEDLLWDDADERNEGVIADELVLMSGEFTMRVVTYEDPETGKIWKYITSDLTLPPGVVVHLYRMRWNIEKVFDETENKLHENKGWGVSANAKRMQAEFTALTHNLMLLFEAKVEREEEIRDEKVERKYQVELKRRTKEASKLGRCLPKMVERLRRRATQFSCQFIRWLRN